MKSCLVVVDVQNDFCEGGALAVNGASQIISPINDIMNQYDSVIATKDSHPQNHISFAKQWNVDPFTVCQNEMRWPDHCVKGTHGWEFHKDLKQIKKIFEKGTEDTMGYSICENNEFVQFIKQYDRVDLCGLAFDYCVRTCAMDIAKIVPKVRILKDLCRTIDVNSEPQIIKELEAAGVEIV